ncbi:YjzD family protein [Pediococcus pentosaceus]|jgi:hypothetical protein|uniref:DUF2929 family protein n=3 Tax=Pediococcus pentosaceus TaxID=1255 RepID=A0A0R2H5P5_PEDPE|nr:MULTISPECIES: YjzD family protein [Pediococcus]ABJ68150.1 hypothetical protein PEPE_1095 [Pediococcus pentosaceus ATCC 25745]ARW19599.1 hypothetical protein S100892_01026 [Pediococcus pentosaceus]ASC08338.1 hypothetical protein S100194_00799 [Pediococcus pentosaceus]AVL01596.1 hypothetical protein PP40703_01695 [Pediococcus pentosaceus]AXR43595.1 DUF2929 domain-containing protein [Pediococcus pentosaceus]
MKQIVVIFWAFIFGEVIGYIGGQLDALPYTPLEIGIVAAVVALITSNMIPLISKPKK